MSRNSSRAASTITGLTLLLAFVTTACSTTVQTPGPTSFTPSTAAPTSTATTVSTATATPQPSATASSTPPPVEPTSTPSPSATPAPTARPSPTATPSPTPHSILYVVARGDTLSQIARRYATTWQSLIFWNRDRYASLNPASRSYNPSLIEVGWRLVVWPGVVVSYNPPLPTATPRPATPEPTATPKPTTPPSSAASVLVSHGSRTNRMVALTFDGGGRAGDSVAIMRWLRDHNVPATIFITGASATTTTGREVISIINARPDLFDLGNHSYSHPDMTKLTIAQIVDQLRRAEAAILATAKQSPRPIFRPPYGGWDNDVLVGAGRAGYPWTVMWDVDPIDWKAVADGGPTASQIVSRVLSKAQGGSIILNHLGGWNTLDALPNVVAGLRARGYSLVTLERLLRS